MFKMSNEYNETIILTCVVSSMSVELHQRLFKTARNISNKNDNILVYTIHYSYEII